MGILLESVLPPLYSEGFNTNVPVAFGNNVTIASGKTLAITTADKLTVGGAILPQNYRHGFTGLGASTTSFTGFIADAAYQLVGLRAVWGTASTSGTLSLEKLTGTQAIGGGVGMVSATIDLSGTANTVATGSLSATAADLLLATGNRVALVFGGTMTNLANLAVYLTLKRV